MDADDSQRSAGLHGLVAGPRIYRAVQNAFGARRFRRTLVERHLRLRGGERVLDLGCGPADLLELLPELDYTGIDADERQLAVARRRFGRRGAFHLGNAADLGTHDGRDYDLVLAIGLLHHLTDDAVAVLAREVAPRLIPDGRLVTADACRGVRRHPVATLLLAGDRGRHVRDEAGYRALLEPDFATVDSTTYRDLLRVPYGYVVIEARV